MNSNNTLWVEKYRPDTLEGYIGNDTIVGKMKTYIEGGDIPHLLFYGRAGTGKSRGAAAAQSASAARSVAAGARARACGAASWCAGCRGTRTCGTG